MSKEYYTIEKKSNLGEQFVSQEVFKSIANEVIEKEDKVKIAGSKMPGNKSALEISISDHNQVTITSDVDIDYGVNVNSIISSIQQQILEKINYLLGIKNVKININVKNINFK